MPLLSVITVTERLCRAASMYQVNDMMHDLTPYTYNSAGNHRWSQKGCVALGFYRD